MNSLMTQLGINSLVTQLGIGLPFMITTCIMRHLCITDENVGYFITLGETTKRNYESILDSLLQHLDIAFVFPSPNKA